MAIAPTDFADIVMNTRSRVQKRLWTDISMAFPQYLFVDRVIKGKKFKIRGSHTIQENLQVRNNSSFELGGAYDPTQAHVQDVANKITETWSSNRCHTMWADDELVYQGDSDSEIIDVYDQRVHAMENDYVEGMEYQFLGTPSSSSQSPMPIKGLKYWLQSNATEGFNGGDPSGFSAGAGNVSTGTVPAWANFTNSFSVVSQTDLFDKLSRALKFCDFRAPNPYPSIYEEGHRWSILTTLDNIQEFEVYTTGANDNIGTDIGRFRGMVTFRGIPLEYWWVLSHPDSTAVDSADTLYGVDWNTWNFYFQRGFDGKIDVLPMGAQQVGVTTMWMRTIAQLMCGNRRRNFRIYRV